ncbi:MAG TPA: ribbon-helix-helix domain-containing protein [Anaerolineae bacterium]
MRENMVRTQVYLPRKIHEQLQARAEKQGLTLAVQIREALADYIERVESEADDGILHADDPIFQLIGSVSSKEGDLSINHDHYLYGWPKRETTDSRAASRLRERSTDYRTPRKKAASRRRRK